MLNAILHTVAGERELRWLTQEISLVEVLKCGNEQMAARCIEQSFVTTFLCVWDPKLRTLTYARAGHPPAMLLRGGQIKLLDAVGDLPLGIFTETTYSQHTEALEPGDVIVLYTDGLSEAVDEDGEMFNETRLAEAAQSAPNTSAQSVLEHVWNAVVQHQAGATPRDDQTLLVLRVEKM
jgi:sigma-B regulation protein RsbU (phosphoserine phosphatase)